MEFEIWAEKYRPKKFGEIINQKHAVERVKAFAKAKNVPHMIFAGPAGVGKTTLALVLAKELYGKNWRQNVLELNASVTPDTQILIKSGEGIRRITIGELADEFFTEERERYKEIDGIKILSIDKETLKVGFKDVKNISRHKVERIAKINLEGGGEIKTSLDHSIIIFDEKFKLSSKKVEELKPGDYLISFTSTIDGRKDEIDLSPYKPQEFNELRSRRMGNPKIRKVFDKLKIDADLAYFFGCYLAEGCLSFRGSRSGQIILSFGFPSEIAEIEKIRKIVAEKLGLNVTLEKGYSGFDRSRNSSMNVRIFNTQLAKFIADGFYLDGRKIARNKKLPSFVYSLPIEQRINFLQGYLNDGTGEWGKRVRFSSVSKNLLVDVAWFIRLSGLFSSIFEREVRICWCAGTTYHRKDLLPADLFVKFAERVDKKTSGNWRYVLRHNLYGKKCKFISKKNAKKFLNLVDEGKLNEEERKIMNNLSDIVNSDLNVVRIKDIKIEDYHDWVYDVSVEGSEMFFGGSLPVLLHNSDARGIDVIRGQVKDFARTKAIGDVPYKIIILDEADNLTPDAQNALRRTMEMYTSVSRFILIANYSSRIIDPLQSRCAIFRFRALSDVDVKKFINRIVKGENIKITKNAIQAIMNISEGDLRRVANLLQASSALGKKITEDMVYEIASRAKPKDVKEMLENALKGKFDLARKKLQDLLLRQGLAGSDIISEIHKQIYNLPLKEEDKVKLIEKCGEYEFRISEGANELIQLEALLSHFLLFVKK